MTGLIVRKPGAFSRNRVLIFTSLGHFTNDGTIFFIPLIVDLLELTYHIGAILITISLMLFYLSMAASANMLSSFVDRKDLHVQGMFFGIFTLSFGLLLFSIALDGVFVPFLLLLSSIITGFGASLYHPTGTSILQSNYKGSKLGIYLGINGSAGSLGRALYPSLLFFVGLILASNVYSIGFFGILGIFFSILIFLGLRDYKVSREVAEAGGEQSKSNDRKNVFGRSAITMTIVLLTVISLIRSLAFYGIISWIPEYISLDKGVGTNISLGYLLTLMFAGGVLGQLVFGKLVVNHDKRLLLTANTIISALLMFLYISTTGFASLTALGLFGFVNFSGFPLFMSMISDYVPKGSTTTSNALVWNLGGTGGQAMGPLIVGLMIGGSYANLPAAFEVLLVVAVLSALVALKLPRPAKVSKVPLFG